MDTRVGCSAFVHIEVAVSPVESLFTRALIVVSFWMTRGVIAARLAGTVILLRAVGSCPTKRTRALVGVKSGQSAGSSILAWTGVTGIGHTCLTKWVLEAQGTLTSEGWSLARISRWSQDAGSSILANLFFSVTVVSELAILSCVIRRASKIILVKTSCT